MCRNFPIFSFRDCVQRVISKLMNMVAQAHWVSLPAVEREVCAVDVNKPGQDDSSPASQVSCVLLLWSVAYDRK